MNGMDCESYKCSQYNVCTPVSGGYLVMNTITGATVELSNEEYSVLTRNVLSLQQDILCKLIELGFVVDSNLDEKGLLRYAYNKSKYSSETVRMTVCPTLDCNFACPYCYENRFSGAMSSEIQSATVDFIESQLQQKQSKTLSLCWYGGEPLLYPSIIERISAKLMEYCTANSIRYYCSMVTNGYLITEENIKILKKIQCDDIQITVDGLPETHNKRRILRNGGETFSQIFSSIQLLNARGINVRIRVNIDKDNLQSYHEVEKLFSSLENVTCYPAPVTVEKTQSQEQRCKCFGHDEYEAFYSAVIDYGEFLNILDKSFDNKVRSCMAETDGCYVVDPFGYTYKCLNDVGHPENSIGKVTEPGVNNPAGISKYLGRDPFTEDECKDCKYLPLCFGYCIWECKDKGSHACPPIKYCLTEIMKMKARQVEIIEDAKAEMKDGSPDENVNSNTIRSCTGRIPPCGKQSRS